MQQYAKDWIKAIIMQFIVYIVMLAALSLASAWAVSCSREDGVSVKREFVTGSYYIEETSETITFSENGIWHYDKSAVYPGDYIFGTFSVDEENTGIVYCFYYIESEDVDKADTMRLTHVTDTKYTGTGVPTHGKDSVFTLTKKHILSY